MSFTISRHLVTREVEITYFNNCGLTADAGGTSMWLKLTNDDEEGGIILQCNF